MNITLCGSIAFIQNMLQAKQVLENAGHTVQMPPTHITAEDGSQMPVLDYYNMRKAAEPYNTWVWQTKAAAMRNHFNKVVWCDAVLVVNEDKNGIPSYIEPNTFLEVGLAFHLSKKIYLLHSLPQQDFTEELLGMGVVELQGSLDLE